jgi:Concanavalin A-like lectin/glucanases superfamily
MSFRGPRTITAWAALTLLAAGDRLSAQNQSANFSATNTSWISAPAGLDLTPPAGFTVEAWVRVDSIATVSRGIIYVPTPGSPSGSTFAYSLSVTSNLQGSTISFQGNTSGIPSAGTFGITGGPFSTGSWHHFAGTYDNAIVRLYIDGVLYGIWNGHHGSVLPSDTTLRIGCLQAPQWVFKNGSIDCVRIWDHALSPSELASFRYFEIPKLPGLVASWYLNGDLNDSTGGHHGTGVGTVAMAGPGAPITQMLSAPSTSPIGSVLTLQIATPFPATPYIADVSLTGSAPGVVLYPEGILIPLNLPWLNWDSGGLLSAYFTNFLGLTNAAGTAQAFASVPLEGWLSGQTVSASYAVLQPGLPYAIGYVAPPTHTLLTGMGP